MLRGEGGRVDVTVGPSGAATGLEVMADPPEPRPMGLQSGGLNGAELGLSCLSFPMSNVV